MIRDLRDWREQRDWWRLWRDPPGLMCCCASTPATNTYFFGGFDGHADHNYTYLYVAAWTAKTNIPANNAQMTCPSDSGSGNMMGGETSPGGAGITTNRQYTPDAWTTKTALLVTRKQAASATVDPNEYLVGGSAAGVSFSGRNDAYNTGTDSWTNKTSMTTGVQEPAGATVGGHPYMMGGGTSPSNTPSQLNQQYSTGGDSWASKAVLNNTTTAAGFGANLTGGLIYGGANGAAPMTTAQQYDPVGDAWSAKTSMPANAVERFGYTSLFAFGGENSSALGEIKTRSYSSGSNSWVTGVDFPNSAVWFSCASTI